MRASPSLQVTDFGSLTEHEVIKPFVCYADICYLPGDKKVHFFFMTAHVNFITNSMLTRLSMSYGFTTVMFLQTQQLDCSLTVDPVFIRIGKGAVHTLSCSAHAWNQVICGDSSEGAGSTAKCVLEAVLA